MIDSAPHAPAQSGSPQQVGLRGTGQSETTLFRAEGVLVTSEQLVASGRTWRLGEVERVDAIHRAPRALPLLITLGLCAALGLPALLSAMAAAGSEARGLYGAGLAAAAVVIFGCIARLVLMGDTYWLVVRTQRRERRVFGSRDHQLVSSLAAVVSKAAAARQRP